MQRFFVCGEGMAHEEIIPNMGCTGKSLAAVGRLGSDPGLTPTWTGGCDSRPPLGGTGPAADEPYGAGRAGWPEPDERAEGSRAPRVAV